MNRSKSPLALMELVIMVLVFALAAALCLQVFAFSGQVSRRNEAVDLAVQVCQNAAETLKSAGGDAAHAMSYAANQMGGQLSQDTWSVYYDEEWNVFPSKDGCTYRLLAQEQSSHVEGLIRADIQVYRVADEDELFSLTVAWQEVTGDE